MPAQPAPRQFATSPRSVNTSHQTTTTSLCFFRHSPRSLAWCEKVSPERDTKKKKFSHEGGPSQSPVECASPPSLPGPNGVNITPTENSSKDDTYDRLSGLITGLFEKLDRKSEANVLKCSNTDYSVFHEVSPSESEEREIPENVPDPMDELDTFNCGQDNREAEEDNAGFLKVLDELSGHFHGEEEKGEPLTDRLASILNSSLRRRPTSEGVKMTCSKIRLPSNVPNLTVPATNTAITKAMSVGGKLIDARLFHTNGLISKALIRVAECISDIGEKKSKTINCYLEGLNNSLRLLTSVVNYIHHLRKEVARIHVHDRALAELCKWECEVWFPMALQLLEEAPLLLPHSPLVLPQNPSLSHPRAQKLILTAMVLSGKPTKIKTFRQKLPSFFLHRGEKAQNYNMGRISRDGCHFVSEEKLIHFRHL
ncbi:hypothetical protein Pcinc_003767 [Petrolisthes cinctipes]|uniref:Uncharacterized protein n=1 Tax=Petrolisthes cinctipes TaxID=88211 RepID=A0AAE1GII5_PETCI|nr:hypothetical protein Pcinc_003767 [Petrolisthes cinctipes]